MKLSLVAWFATNGSVYAQWVQQFVLARGHLTACSKLPAKQEIAAIGKG